MRYEHTAKHAQGGWGSPCIFSNDDQARRALEDSVVVKPGMRAVRVPDGRVAVFRAASKKPNTVGCDDWHGGWEAKHAELRELGRVDVPTFNG